MDSIDDIRRDMYYDDYPDEHPRRKHDRYHKCEDCAYHQDLYPEGWTCSEGWLYDINPEKEACPHYEEYMTESDIRNFLRADGWNDDGIEAIVDSLKDDCIITDMTEDWLTDISADYKDR